MVETTMMTSRFVFVILEISLFFERLCAFRSPYLESMSNFYVEGVL